ncbi:hypothetical protein G6F56_004156 [Rhizopus delemar]|nr:hypothetical protein G6F56_004156 [Rhizopus delemar]
MNSSEPISETKKTKYILITHGDSYLGRVLAIYLSEEITKYDKKEHWAVRVMCAENTKLQKEFEKRGIDVKLIDYESQKMIREAMQGHVKTMIFNPFTDHDRLVVQAKNILKMAKEEKIGYTLMISSIGASINQQEQAMAFSQFREIEEHLKEMNEYGKWVILRVPFIQQYLYFWAKMIEDKAMIGMPIAQTDVLETVHVKDICDSVAHLVLNKRLATWDIHIEKRMYDLRSVPTFSLYDLTQSLSDSLKEDGKTPDINSVVLTEEQMQSYLECVAEGSKKMKTLLDSVSHNLPAVPKTGILVSIVSGVFSMLWTHKDQDDPRWYPTDALTPFSIQLIMNHFQLARNPQWLPELGNPTDIRDLTGVDPIPLSEFFMNNRRRFRGNL